MACGSKGKMATVKSAAKAAVKAAKTATPPKAGKKK